MNSLKYLTLDERLESAGPVHPEPLLGTWLNTNVASGGILRAVLARKGEQIVLCILASGSPEHYDWGEATADIFAADSSSTEAMAFNAFYDFGFMETRLQGHVRQGLLILAKFDRFKDGSGRPNYFSKEFFYRTDA